MEEKCADNQIALGLKLENGKLFSNFGPKLDQLSSIGTVLGQREERERRAGIKK